MSLGGQVSAPSCGPCPRRTACQDPAGHSESEGDVKGRETAGPGKFAARLIKAKQEPLAVGLGEGGLEPAWTSRRSPLRTRPGRGARARRAGACRETAVLRPGLSLRGLLKNHSKVFNASSTQGLALPMSSLHGPAGESTSFRSRRVDRHRSPFCARGARFSARRLGGLCTPGD